MTGHHVIYPIYLDPFYLSWENDAIPDLTKHIQVFSNDSVLICEGIFILGVPAEIYYYGSIYSLLAIGLLLVAPVAGFVFVPIFRNMTGLSAYEVSYT